MSSGPLRLLSVVGARPNFMKIAPLCRAFAARSDKLSHLLVHTGQHYDDAMSGDFFRDLEIPPPEINLEVGSGSHARVTAAVMERFEPVIEERQPDWVVVVGDVNSTLAATLCAVKMGVRVAHVEAGLRSFDRSMPEEINRLATDAVCDLLLTPSPDADANLRREGHPPERIVRVGNVMIDTLVRQLPKADACESWNTFAANPGEYIFLTMHRPGNVDAPEALGVIVRALVELSRDCPVVFPVHPRTRARLESFGLMDELNGATGMRLGEPVGYHDCLCLEKNARLVVTDSGGIQEETTYLGVPCLTVRPNTERPITVDEGSNRLTTPQALLEDARARLAGASAEPRAVPDLWDGHAAERIADLFVTIADEGDR